MECYSCHKTDQETRLHKCPICFTMVCDGCAHRGYGRIFCSMKCADQFFFGDEEE